MGASDAAAVAAIVKRFDDPERVLVFEQGRIAAISVGGKPIGKGSYAPGWHWSHTARGSLPEHVGVVLSGRAKVRDHEGHEFDLTPGDFFHAATEADAWVVGYRPCEILYLSGVEALIKQLRSSTP